MVELTEADIPGASLGGRDPEKFKVAELKFWLRCRGATGLTKLKTKAGCKCDIGISYSDEYSD